jgi:hypothetical protein
MMRKRFAVPGGLVGMLVGAAIGSTYLSNAGSCADPGTPQFSCALNSAYAPFIGCIAIGFVLGIGIGRIVASWVDRAVGSISLERPASPALPEQARPAPEPLPAAPRDGSLGSRGKPRPTPRGSV